MSLIEFNSGELALASDINNNFNYLDSLIGELSEDIESRTNSFSSQVTALSNSVNDVLSNVVSYVATGTILPYAGSTAPNGYLICDGSEIKISEFSELYSVIGTLYGSSDSTTFCLPNLVDKTVWGAMLSNMGETIPPKLPNIEGSFRLYGTEGSSDLDGMFSSGPQGGSRGKGHDSGAKNPLITLDASSQSDIYSKGFNSVQPPAVAINFIIKY